MEKLIPLLQRAGVRAMFSGHEHNFQHSAADGIHYFVSGAGGKRRTGTPDRFDRAFTQSWSNDCHFLLVEIAGTAMTVRAIGEPGPGGELTDISRADTNGNALTGPISITLG
jgi:hypothetical protein